MYFDTNRLEAGRVEGGKEARRSYGVHVQQVRCTERS